MIRKVFVIRAVDINTADSMINAADRSIEGKKTFKLPSLSTFGKQVLREKYSKKYLIL